MVRLLQHQQTIFRDDCSEPHNVRTLHRPVMLKEVLEILSPRRGDIILDCTVGTGGHASSILEKIMPDGSLLGIDKDEDALSIADEKLRDRGGRFYLFQGDFRNFDIFLKEQNIDRVDKIFFDLGLSSLQLENPERGFSFLKEGPLDMRMDKNAFISAFDLVNNLGEEELTRILRNFGQEPFAQRIAYSIVRVRKEKPLYTTTQLSEVVLRSIPSRYRYHRIHPATRTFQALRIAVNRELESLTEALSKIIYFLNKGGICLVISFHSLEDRIVKQKFKEFQNNGVFKIITRKPLRPTETEVRTNPRSRSAKLRAGFIC